MTYTIHKGLLFFIVFIFVLSSGTAFARGRWKTGYVVTASGDTVRGEIAYANNASSRNTILFRSDKEGTKVKYAPADLKGFAIQLPGKNIYFKSFSGDIDLSPTEIDLIDNNPLPVLRKCSFFAQLLVAGKKSLYTCRDTAVRKIHFLIEYPEGHLTDLVRKRYYIYNDYTGLADNDLYKQQLRSLYTNCASIDSARIDRVRFYPQSLTKLVRQYNACFGEDTSKQYEYKMEKVQIKAGVLAGGNSNSLHLVLPEYPAIDFNFKTTYNATAGIFFNIILPEKDRSFSFYADVLFTHYDLNFYDQALYYGQHTNITASYVSIAVCGRYRYPYYAVKPFAQIGVVNDYATANSDLRYTDANSIVSSGPESLITFRPHEFGYLAGIGIDYKKFEVEARYTYADGFTQLPDVSIVQHWYLLLKYRFN